MSNRRQKRVAVISDLSCYGRCALTVALPIISAMKIECCPLPTAILSTNAAFPGYVMDDYTQPMEHIMKHWKTLELKFDGIYCGFLGSIEQVNLLTRFFEYFKKEDTVVILDPIMGDNGKLYKATDPNMYLEFRKLLPYIDIITPNYTECCQLLEIPYEEEVPGRDQLLEIAMQLSNMGPRKVVITGIQRDNMIENFIYEKEIGEGIIATKKVGVDRCGTGDVFTSVLTGSVINGDNFQDSVEKSVNFIQKAAKYTSELEISPRNGICFEQFLNTL